MGEEFKTIATQEDFDRAIQERLNRQKESIEKQYADYAEIKARNVELGTEVGALKATLSESNEKYTNYDKDLSELNAKIAGYETASLRTKIALDYGIPYNLASRLVGDDEESIKKDAEQLATLVGNKEPVAPLKDVEPNIEGKDIAYKSLLENLNLEGE